MRKKNSGAFMENVFTSVTVTKNGPEVDEHFLESFEVRFSRGGSWTKLERDSHH